MIDEEQIEEVAQKGDTGVEGYLTHLQVHLKSDSLL